MHHSMGDMITMDMTHRDRERERERDKPINILHIILTQLLHLFV